jgi:hypothetical protein
MRRCIFPIESVTIYPQSALITRREKLKLGAGITKITASSLPGNLTGESVRVEVAENENLIVRDVVSIYRPLEAEADKKYQRIKEELDEFVFAKKQCEATLANTASELDLFLAKESLVARFGNEKYLPVNVESWKEFFGFLSLRLAENRAAARTEQFRLFELEKKIRAASANLALVSAEKRQEHEIVIQVEAPRSGDYLLSLSYLQEQVSWYPVYSISGAMAQKKLSVTLSAVIAQNTAEDWQGVELLFSSAVPHFSCSIPELFSKRLREADAKIQLRKRAEAPGESLKLMDSAEEAYFDEQEAEELKQAPAPLRARSASLKAASKKKMAANFGAGLVMGGDDQQDMEALVPPALPTQPARPKGKPVTSAGETLAGAVSQFEQERGADFVPAVSNRFTDELRHYLTEEDLTEAPAVAGESGVLAEWMRSGVSLLDSLGGYDYRFRAQGRFDVPSRPTPLKVPIQLKDLPMKLVYVTIPLQKEAVFLKALYANDTDNPLPAGPAEVFADESLAGTLLTPTLGPGEAGFVSLGAEKDIKVLRRENAGRRHKGMVSREKITDYTVEIELISFKDETVDIEIYDRLPSSRQVREIAVLDFNAAPSATVTERNILVWNERLEPREKKTISFHYSIRHPENFRLIMEEDSVAFNPGKEE